MYLWKNTNGIKNNIQWIFTIIMEGNGQVITINKKILKKKVLKYNMKINAKTRKFVNKNNNVINVLNEL